MGNSWFMEKLLITGLANLDLIFGLPWFHKYNPQIDWKTGHISIPIPAKDLAIMYDQEDQIRRTTDRNTPTTTIRRIETQDEQEHEALKLYLQIEQQTKDL